MNRVFVTDEAAVGAEETVGEAASPGKAVADPGADKFLRDGVVPWMYPLDVVGSSLPEALDAVLAALGKTSEALVQAPKAKVPWLPCVNVQAVQRTTTNQAYFTFRCCHTGRARTQLMS